MGELSARHVNNPSPRQGMTGLPGRAEQAILAILDPAQGGAPSADYDFLRRELEQRKIHLETAAIDRVLDRLIERSEVVRVPTEDGGALYTRPSVLLREAGVARVLPGPPTRRTRRRS